MKRATHGHVAKRDRKKKKLAIDVQAPAQASEGDRPSEPEDVKAEQPKSKGVCREWTPEEDNFLKTQISGGTKWKWRGICMLLNKKFVGKRCTSKDCMQRWALLRQPHFKTNWSMNEDLILACYLFVHRGLSNIPQTVLTSRTPVDVREHFCSQLRVTSKIIKGNRTQDYLSAPPFQQLQLQVYTRILMCRWEPGLTAALEPEIFEAVAHEQLTEAECLAFLVSARLGTKAQLTTRLDDTISAIEKKLVNAEDGPDDGLRDVLHTRPEVQAQLQPPYPEAIVYPGLNNSYYLMGYIVPYPYPYPLD